MNMNPNVSVDCVVFGFSNKALHVLLIEPKVAGHTERKYALPGDLVREEEGLDHAAHRVLNEFTQLSDIQLHQFYAFGAADRFKNIKDGAWVLRNCQNTQARLITIAYFALVQMNDFASGSFGFAERVFWQDIREIPELACDHNVVVETALRSLRLHFVHSNLGYELLPEKFTLNQLQILHEAVLGVVLDKRNFRKKVLKENLVVRLNEKQRGVLHKPAQLYSLSSSR